MKKFWLKAVALCLGALVLTGCSAEGGCNGCAPTNKLAFTSNWTIDKQYHDEFKETAVYDVVYRDDYRVSTGETETDYSAQKSSEYTVVYGENGTAKGGYTTTVEALQALPSDIGVTVSDTDLYKITTSLTLPVTYNIIDTNKSYTFTDTISSTAYFRSHSSSLSPIYSVKSYDTTQLVNNKDGAYIVRYVYETKIDWVTNGNKAALTVTDKTDSVTPVYTDDDAYRLTAVENYSGQIKYTEGTVLDNETLLFSIRGLTLSSSFTTTLKTLDTAYKSVQSIAVASKRTVNVTDAWTLNTQNTAGEWVEQEYASSATYLTTLNRSDSKYTGQAKHCYYQLTKAETTEESEEKAEDGDAGKTNARAFLIKIVEPLPNKLGALEYRLSTVHVTEK